MDYIEKSLVFGLVNITVSVGVINVRGTIPFVTLRCILPTQESPQTLICHGIERPH